jgi:Fur family ferric uptake transcriptional regulator
MNRNNSMAALREIQATGHRLTGPRRRVVEALFAQQRAVTAAELGALLGGVDVSLASVYRSLDLLVELGLAETVAQPGGEQRYLACSLDHHHHIICDRCGRVAELDECILGPFEALVEERTRYEIDRHTLEFHGRCPACRE